MSVPTLSKALERGLNPAEERVTDAVQEHLLSAAEADPLLRLRLMLKIGDPGGDHYDGVYRSQYYSLPEYLKDALDEEGWHLFNWGCWLSTFSIWDIDPATALNEPSLFNALSE